MPKRVQYGGEVHEFPDDFTDADISAALEPTPTPAGDEMVMAEPEGSAISRGLGRLLAKGKETVIGLGLGANPGVMAVRELLKLPEQYRKGVEQSKRIQAGDAGGVLREGAADLSDQLTGLFGVNPEAVRKMAHEGDLAGIAAEGVGAVGIMLAGGRMTPKSTPPVRVSAKQLVGAAKKGGTQLSLRDAELAAPVLREEAKLQGLTGKDFWRKREAVGMIEPGAETTATKAVQLMPELVNSAKRRIDGVVETAMKPHETVVVSGKQVADAVRKYADGLPPTQAAEQANIMTMADNFDRDMTIGQWNKERVNLSKQSGPQYRKSPVGQAELPSIQTARDIAYAEVRNVVYDNLATLTKRSDLRNLKRQEGALIKVEDKFTKVRDKTYGEQAAFETTDIVEEVSDTGQAISTFGTGAVVRRTVVPQMAPTTKIARRLREALVSESINPRVRALTQAILGRTISGNTGGGGGY